MPTTYRSILIHQPTDGQIVFMRRFTRDPPVLASWSASTNEFTLQSVVTMTIVGGTYAGSYVCAFTASVAGSGLPGWFNQQGAIYLTILNTGPGVWRFYQADFLGNAWHSNATFATAYPNTANAFTADGAPTWTIPTTMAIASTPAAPLIIPAELVQAWRPQ